VGFGSSGSCYKAESPATANTYEEAQDACASDGATVLTTPTLEEFQAVTSWLKSDVQPTRDIYISASFTGSEGGPWGRGTDYTWPDGTSVLDDMWAKKEPSKNTSPRGDPLNIVIWRKKGYKLDNRSPTKPASYVCEKQLEVLECADNDDELPSCSACIPSLPTTNESKIKKICQKQYIGKYRNLYSW